MPTPQSKHPAQGKVAAANLARKEGPPLSRSEKNKFRQWRRPSAQFVQKPFTCTIRRSENAPLCLTDTSASISNLLTVNCAPSLLAPGHNGALSFTPSSFQHEDHQDTCNPSTTAKPPVIRSSAVAWSLTCAARENVSRDHPLPLIQILLPRVGLRHSHLLFEVLSAALQVALPSTLCPTQEKRQSNETLEEDSASCSRYVFTAHRPSGTDAAKSDQQTTRCDTEWKMILAVFTS